MCNLLDIELFVRFNGTAGIMMPTAAVCGDIQICSCLNCELGFNFTFII